jgi:type I site-specific restriction-modification system R (restriction) subunit
MAGSALAPEVDAAERADFSEAVLAGRLRAVLARLNPNLPADALHDAFLQVTQPQAGTLVTSNRAFHRMLVEGVRVEYQPPDGSVAGGPVRLIDYDDPTANDWLVVNQFVVRGAGQVRHPDVVIFVNGLPLAAIELKNPADADATTWEAFNQLQTYKEQISDLFVYNAVLVISDGVDARIGSLTANFERFLPWRTIEGETLAPASMPQLQALIFGVFEQHRFLDLIRHFIVFEDNGGDDLQKKVAAYHQFHAVNKEEVTEGEEIERKESLKSKWTALKAIVGTDKRLALIAADLVEHFERRQETLKGKAMIVCMSREICIALYQQIIRLRPDWHSDGDNQGALKIIMTGSSSDPPAWQQHIRTKARRETLANRIFLITQTLSLTSLAPPRQTPRTPAPSAHRPVPTAPRGGTARRRQGLFPCPRPLRPRRRARGPPPAGPAPRRAAPGGAVC